MKKCPHCHADTFGWRQLVALDYFRPDECEKCKQLVRNDGLRQFLMVLAILGTLAIGCVFYTLMPEVLEPFGLVLLVLLMGLPVILISKPVKFESKVSLPPFSPDAKNDKLITVSGWSEAELGEIVEGFLAEDRSGWPPYGIKIEKEFDDAFRMIFPDDIHPSLFAGLINYVMYPIEYVSANRKIIAVGKSTLNKTFQGIPKELFGQKAFVYVPENDEDYDVVYLQSETGSTFANSFREDGWQRVDEARLPRELRNASNAGIAKPV